MNPSQHTATCPRPAARCLGIAARMARVEFHATRNDGPHADTSARWHFEERVAETSSEAEVANPDSREQAAVDEATRTQSDRE